jgi:DnaJ-class molecular chaperone
MGAPVIGAPITDVEAGVTSVTERKMSTMTGVPEREELARLPCAFCRGEGKDPFDLLSEKAACGVCGGRGEVTVAEPIYACAFCCGTGVFPGSRLTCTTCMGKGLVTIEEPAEACRACLGTGVVAGHTLPCSICGGRGRVTAAGDSSLRRPKLRISQGEVRANER